MKAAGEYLPNISSSFLVMKKKTNNAINLGAVFELNRESQSEEAMRARETKRNEHHNLRQQHPSFVLIKLLVLPW